MLNLAEESEERSRSFLLNSLSLGFIEALYADYLSDPSSVSADWRRRYFKQLSNGSHNGASARLRAFRFARRACSNPPGRRTAGSDDSPRRDLRDGGCCKIGSTSWCEHIKRAGT